MAELLLLRRRLGSGDAHRWRTMLRLPPVRMRLARHIDPQVPWRVTTAQGESVVPG